MTLKSKLSNLTAHFQYYAALALAEDGSTQKVRDELTKSGWRFKNSLSDDEIKAIVQAGIGVGPAAHLLHNKINIFSPEGQEICTRNSDPKQDERYKQAVRKSAAAIYYGTQP